MDNNNKFTYTYSAPTDRERKEIEKIRKQYDAVPKDSSQKAEKLRRLDSKVKNTAIVASLSVGIISSLILGLGMSLVMTFDHMLEGIVVGFMGIFGVIATPFINSLVSKHMKQKYSKEIIELCDELLGGESKKDEN